MNEVDRFRNGKSSQLSTIPFLDIKFEEIRMCIMSVLLIVSVSVVLLIIIIFGIRAINKRKGTKTSSNYYIYSGDSKCMSGRNEEGIMDYTKAIQLNPTNSIAYNARGLAKAQLSDYEGAVQDYNEAIEIEPNYAKAYNNRGVAKKFTKRLPRSFRRR